MIENESKKNIVFYCCTYSKDLNRTIRLVDSVSKHNKDRIPFYISVPEEDLNLFKNALLHKEIILFNERDILRANPKLNLNTFYQIDGSLRQQVVKSEFWRLNLCDNYLVLDADCVFIKDFFESDFIVEGNIPYSIIHEGKEILQATSLIPSGQHRKHFISDRAPIKNALGRSGIIFDYGYAPFIWNTGVWASLDRHYLIPHNMTFLDAILFCASEFTWYGESLLCFKAIPIYPREQLFKIYHYEHQLWTDQLLGVNPKILAKDYLGIVFQSNWQTWEDHGYSKKSQLSLYWRAIKRLIKKLQFNLNILFRLFMKRNNNSF